MICIANSGRFINPFREFLINSIRCPHFSTRNSEKSAQLSFLSHCGRKFCCINAKNMRLRVPILMEIDQYICGILINHIVFLGAFSLFGIRGVDDWDVSQALIAFESLPATLSHIYYIREGNVTVCLPLDPYQSICKGGPFTKWVTSKDTRNRETLQSSSTLSNVFLVFQSYPLQ